MMEEVRHAKIAANENHDSQERGDKGSGISNCCALKSQYNENRTEKPEADLKSNVPFQQCRWQKP